MHSLSLSLFLTFDSGRCIQEIALSGCGMISDDSLVMIGRALPLQSLALAGLAEVTSASVAAAVSNRRQGDGTATEDTERDTEGGARNESGGSAATLPSALRALDLTRCKRVAVLETAQLRAIFSLGMLDLSYCPAATSDDALRRAAAACTGQSTLCAPPVLSPPPPCFPPALTARCISERVWSR